MKLLCSFTSFIFNTLLPLRSSPHREYLNPQLCCANLRGSGCQEPPHNSHRLRFQKWPCAWEVHKEQPNIAYSPYLQQAEAPTSTESTHQLGTLGRGAARARQHPSEGRRKNQAPARLKICMFIIKMFWGYFLLLFRKGKLFLIKDHLSRLNFVDLWVFSCYSKTEGPLVEIKIVFGRGRMLG